MKRWRAAFFMIIAVLIMPMLVSTPSAAEESRVFLSAKELSVSNDRIAVAAGTQVTTGVSVAGWLSDE
jgi:hypothetical protein